ncbi:MAG: ABC transporter permease [Chloroflexi bacterium]|nr:ABC transporter permease [Chloroflexota bacterium]
MGTFLLFQASFGLLALLLSGVLVVNMLSALMAGQIRQIGVMKAVGAQSGQVMGVYLGTVAFLGLLALTIAIPVGVSVGEAFANFISKFLNFDLASYAVPPWVFGLEIAIGLLVPLMAAAFPVYRGSRVTVQEAISDYGVGRGSFGASALDRWLGRVSGLARPWLLSLRNTFRRRVRLGLTLTTLAAGGMVFMAALNVRASFINTLDQMFNSARYDISVGLAQLAPIAQVEQVVRNTPGVTQFESWGMAEAVVVYADGCTGLVISKGLRYLAPLDMTVLLLT